MSKFTFICEDEAMPFSDGIVTKRTFEFDAVMLQDIIAEFELFLRGSGFNLPGVLTFAEEEFSQVEDTCAQEDTSNNAGYDYDLNHYDIPGSDTKFTPAKHPDSFVSKGYR